MTTLFVLLFQTQAELSSMYLLGRAVEGYTVLCSKDTSSKDTSSKDTSSKGSDMYLLGRAVEGYTVLY